jgi:amino acid adenylation domain-containing protein
MDETLGTLLRCGLLLHPDRLAVSDETESFSYRELDNASDQLIHELSMVGDLRGARGVLFCEKRARNIAIALAMFKVGSIYVPLDPATPSDRLRWIFNDIQPNFVVTDSARLEATRQLLGQSVPVLCIDSIELRRKCTARSVASRAASKDPAYCIYTSGSTGRPKGVLVSHSNVLAFFQSQQDAYRVEPESRCLSFAPLHFDASVMDIFYPLSRGASVYLHCGLPIPDRALAALMVSSATHVVACGPMLGIISNASAFHSSPMSHLQTVLTGGEPPLVPVVQRWLRRLPGLRIINAYGPTEATVACAAFEITEPDPHRSAPYPIGKPLATTRLDLLDDSGQLIQETPARGELIIGGPQVALGYWNNPLETERRFYDRDGIRYYRSGDICQRVESGDYVFLHRADDEIKVRGQRVHMNEVRAALSGIGDVDAAEVFAERSLHGEPYIVAAVTLNNSSASTTELLDALRSQLPSHMMPRRISVLNEFPQTSSGKTDRIAILNLLKLNLDPT